MFPLPQTLTHNITSTFGDGGRAWLQRLPDLIATFERRWGLNVQRPSPFDLSYAYVAPAVRTDGSQVVLKLGVPHRELYGEIAALRHYDGCGIARLLEADPDEGALLLERLEPGAMLSELADDEEATRIGAQVMQKLWRPVPDARPFIKLSEWTTGLQGIREHFGGGTGPLPENLVGMAQRLFEELQASTSGTVLLHGDLHHYNILTAMREPWLAIDPKGVVGTAGYDVGPFLLNPNKTLPHMPNLKQVLTRRVEILSEVLGMERERVAGWGVAYGVLSAWWNVESDIGGWEPELAAAEHLTALL